MAGLFCLLLWIPIYRRPHEHPRVSPAELALINSDPPETVHEIPWVTLLAYSQTWAFAIAKFLTDSMWWFYMTWLAKFFDTRHGLDLKHVGLPDTPSGLLERGFGVVHSLKGDAEADARSFFAAARA